MAVLRDCFAAVQVDRQGSRFTRSTGRTARSFVKSSFHLLRSVVVDLFYSLQTASGHSKLYLQTQGELSASLKDAYRVT